MMRAFKISVIIPVYNAGQYIERCCESLFSQTLDSIEYVFVNDGSKDNSIELIRRMLNKYPHRADSTKIIDRNENRGVSYTRQEGLEHSTGEYVIHCDADDWVEIDMYATLYDEAKKKDADIVCCGYQIDEDDRHIIIEVPSNYEVTFNVSPLYGSLCNKAIRKFLIDNNKIHFVEKINWGEDFLFSTQCQVFASKIIAINKPFYHYVQNSLSITHRVSLEKMQELLSCGKEMEKFLQDRNLTDKYTFHLHYLKFQLKQRFLRDPSLRDFKKWKETYPECHDDIDSYPIARYLKETAKLVRDGKDILAKIILKTYDFYIRIRK